MLGTSASRKKGVARPSPNMNTGKKETPMPEIVGSDACSEDAKIAASAGPVQGDATPPSIIPISTGPINPLELPIIDSRFFTVAGRSKPVPVQRVHAR